MDGQKLLKKASSVFVSHLVVAQRSPSALLLFGLRERCCVPHKVKDISDLKERIIAAVETTDEEMLRRTWIEI